MGNKINKAWHEKNKMPKNATLDQRIAWHTEHHKHCLCRDIPEKLKAEIIKKDCIEVDLNSPQIKTTPITHFIRWCSFQFLKLTFNLFTFYYKSEDS